jgi:hypothetical protein
MLDNYEDHINYFFHFLFYLENFIQKSEYFSEAEFNFSD